MTLHQLQQRAVHADVLVELNQHAALLPDRLGAHADTVATSVMSICPQQKH